jgi:prepilin-type N-terminal cleavage/methylation domain-containing protein
MKNKKGFTLIELLAVIAILAILVVFAVPNIIKMFGDSKKKAFVTQAQSVFEAAESEIIARQFKNPGTSINRFYSENASDRLSLSKSDNLKYCIKVENGKVTSIAVVDGSYWYINDNITKASEIDTSDSDKFGSGDKLISCSSTGAAELDAENPIISIGDEKIYGTEHFYVVSTNSTTTVLLAKYSLLVGDVIDITWKANGDPDTCTYNKTLSSSDTGYGLQNSAARGYVSGAAQFIGVVPFSGTNYWDNTTCQHTGTTWSCSSNSNSLKSKYGSDYDSYPSIYESTMSSEAPSLNYERGYGLAQSNNYTIAYYVEAYVSKLKAENGLPSTATGRLLKISEATQLGCDLSVFNCLSSPEWFINGTTFWIDTAYHRYGLIYILRDDIYGRNATYADEITVRPVIEIPTSSFFES